jgi:hypothetical protein
MLIMKERRAAFRTIEGWAKLVLLAAVSAVRPITVLQPS